MTKKIIGAVLIVAGIVALAILIGNGMIFPHIVGPLILITAGIITLISKRKDRKEHE